MTTGNDFSKETFSAQQFVAMIQKKASELPVVGEVDWFGEVVTQENVDLALERLGSFAAAVCKQVK